MLSKEASSTIFWVFGMTRPGTEPRSPGWLANTLTARPMSGLIHINNTYKLCIVWNWFIVKIISLFQTECSRLEQRSVIIFLVSEKCKPREIYRRMCDVYGEAYFSQKYVYQWTKCGFATMSLILKDSPWCGNILTFQ